MLQALKAIFFLKSNFLSFFLAVLGLRCCVGFSLVVVSGGYSVVVVRGLLSVASFALKHGLESAWASVIVSHRL